MRSPQSPKCLSLYYSIADNIPHIPIQFIPRFQPRASPHKKKKKTSRPRYICAVLVAWCPVTPAPGVHIDKDLGCSCLPAFIHAHKYVLCMYIYIWIDMKTYLSLSLYKYVYIYIYIFIHIHNTCTFIHVHA